MENTKNELVNLSEEMNAGAYCSLSLDNIDNKKKIYNVTSNGADEALGEHINETILLKDIYVEMVPCAIRDEKGNKTEAVEIRPRVILFDETGKSFGCVSKGVFNSLANIIRIFGLPETWESALPVAVKQKNVRGNKVTVLELV